MSPFIIAIIGALPEYVKINGLNLWDVAAELSQLIGMNPKYAGGVYLNELLQAAQGSNRARVFACAFLLSSRGEKLYNAIPPGLTPVQRRAAIASAIGKYWGV